MILYFDNKSVQLEKLLERLFKFGRIVTCVVDRPREPSMLYVVSPCELHGSLARGNGAVNYSIHGCLHGFGDRDGVKEKKTERDVMLEMMIYYVLEEEKYI